MQATSQTSYSLRFQSVISVSMGTVYQDRASDSWQKDHQFPQYFPAPMPPPPPDTGKCPVAIHPQRAKAHKLVVPSTLHLLSRSVPDEKTQAQSSALLSSSLAMDSEYEIGHVRKLQAQHTHMQEKTFTNWINNIFRLGRVSKV